MKWVQNRNQKEKKTTVEFKKKKKTKKYSFIKITVLGGSFTKQNYYYFHLKKQSVIY